MEFVCISNVFFVSLLPGINSHVMFMSHCVTSLFGQLQSY